MNESCPACQAHREHTDQEFKDFHPYAVHGYTKEQGWTHPDLKLDAEEREHENNS